MRAPWITSLIFSVFMHAALAAEPVVPAPVPNDNEALAGLKEVRMIFDFNVSDPKKIMDRLELIENTRDGVLKSGLIPHFVVAFRGLSSRFTQKDTSLIKPEEIALAVKIHDKLVAMSQDSHLDLNQCALANSKQKVKNEDTFPELKLVTNSLITIGAYQNKGYAYVMLD